MIAHVHVHVPCTLYMYLSIVHGCRYMYMYIAPKLPIVPSLLTSLSTPLSLLPDSLHVRVSSVIETRQMQAMMYACIWVCGHSASVCIALHWESNTPHGVNDGIPVVTCAHAGAVSPHLCQPPSFLSPFHSHCLSSFPPSLPHSLPPPSLRSPSSWHTPPTTAVIDWLWSSSSLSSPSSPSGLSCSCPLSAHWLWQRGTFRSFPRTEHLFGLWVCVYVCLDCEYMYCVYVCSCTCTCMCLGCEYVCMCVCGGSVGVF